MNPLVELLERHVSCRDFRDEAIPDALVHRLVRAAQQSATDATGQLYSLLWVRDPERKREMVRLMGTQEFPAAAPLLFVVCLDVRRVRLLLEHRGAEYGMRSATALLFGITDASLMAQSLTLALESEGLGTCYLGSVQNNSRAIARLLSLPPGVVPLYGLCAGRPAHPGPAKPRLATPLVLHVDAYSDPGPADLDEAYRTMAAATRSGDWLNPVRKYFARGGIMDGREEEIRGLLEDQGLGLGNPAET